MLRGADRGHVMLIEYYQNALNQLRYACDWFKLQFTAHLMEEKSF